MEALLSMEQVLEELGLEGRVGRETIRRWVHRGELRGFRLSKRLWRFRREDLDAFLRTRDSRLIFAPRLSVARRRRPG